MYWFYADEIGMRSCILECTRATWELLLLADWGVIQLSLTLFVAVDFYESM